MRDLERSNASSGCARSRAGAVPARRRTTTPRSASLLDELDPDDAVDVIRAFNLYFQMVNLAEELHRERRRRERALHGEPPLRGSLETLSPRAAAAIDRIEIALVFTAHPTEVLRRTTSEKLAAVAELLRTLDERVLTAEESAATEAELHAQIVLLWQTNELYRTAPTVQDEVRNLLARFRESIFDEATLLFERLEARLGRAVPAFLSFGSWIGADRDGNANVAPDAIVAAHEQARSFVLGRYLEVGGSAADAAVAGRVARRRVGRRHRVGRTRRRSVAGRALHDRTAARGGAVSAQARVRAPAPAADARGCRRRLCGSSRAAGGARTASPRASARTAATTSRGRCAG